MWALNLLGVGMQRCDWVVFLPFAGEMVLLSGAIDIQAFDMFSGVADGNSSVRRGFLC